jgi:hypothetical protein
MISHMTRTSKAAVAASVLAAYVGVFSIWWLEAKRTVCYVDGHRQVAVEVHQNAFMHHTQPLWEPAFWFMEHCCGYHYAGYVPGKEDAAFVYEK